MAEYTFFFLTVVGDVILRFREPGLERPYKPPIVVPLLFCIVSGFVVVRGAVFAPVQFGILAAELALGVVWYYAWNWWQARRAS
jgi:amino acid transporter